MPALHSDTPFSPPRSSPSSTSLPQYEPLTRLSQLPRSVYINKGVSLSDGCVMLNWELSLDGQSLLSPSAVIALALNEAGRAAGVGKVTYVPLGEYGFGGSGRSRRDRKRQGSDCSADDDFNCEREGLSSVPELFYNGSQWSQHEIIVWDNASHVERLDMIRRPDIDENVIPVRVLIRDRIRGEKSIRGLPKPRRLSAAVLVYDNRPFLDWYCNFARRRNGPGPDIEISFGSDRLGFSSLNGSSDKCTCGDVVDPMLLSEQDLRIKRVDVDVLPQTPTSPSTCNNSQWLGSMYQSDNLAVMRRLSYMWMHPVSFGIVRMGEVLERIFQVKGARENGMKPRQSQRFTRSKTMRTARDDRTAPSASHATIASSRGVDDNDGPYDREKREARNAHDEVDDGNDNDDGDDEMGYTLQRCIDVGVREIVREIRWTGGEEHLSHGDDSEQCMFDVDFYDDEELSGA
ncbi:hypothetical protein KEM56_003425 [Ascosphaera pollenicola]|nr:hypothetical protein KEM56_003425 [Ascosphaera pollenicola]